MTEKEAIQLLDSLIPQNLKLTNKHYIEDLKTLAQTLGYLPLALSQAGSYIANSATTIADYLSLYATDKDKLLADRSMPPMDHHEPVYVTWDMSIKKLKELPKGKQITDLLDIISCCYPEHIPKKLLAQYLYGKADNEHMIKLHGVLGLLRQYSLIKVFANDVSVHRLVQCWMQSKSNGDNPERILQKSASVIKDTYPTHHGSNKTTDEIVFIKSLLPHVEMILSQISGVVSEDKYVDLVLIQGDIYVTIGDYNRSKQFLEKSLKIHEQYYGSEHIETARVLYRLGTTLRKLGDYEKSKQLLEEALKINEQYYGSDHIETAWVLDHLGATLRELNNDVQSKQFLEKSLKIHEQYYGIDHIDTARVLRDLGVVLHKLGDYEKSKQLLGKAVSIQEKYYGSNNSDVGSTLIDLAQLENDTGNSKHALYLIERAINILQNYPGLNPDNVYIKRANKVKEMILKV